MFLLYKYIQKKRAEQEAQASTDVKHPPEKPSDIEKAYNSSNVDMNAQVSPCASHAEQGHSGGKIGKRIAGHIQPLGTIIHWVDLIWMLNAKKRHQAALHVATSWGISVVIVGIVFTCLCATGTFPTSVSNMKYVGVYTEYQAKYALYIVAGVLTVAGTVMMYKALKKGASPRAGQMVMVLAILVCFSTIGITIYLITKDAQLHMEWWSYLIQGLVLVQRLCLFLSIIVALYAVHEAQQDDEVRSSLVETGY